VIDLHLHTTASDGLLAPSALISQAAAAGLTTVSITDHDTVAGLAEGGEAAARLGLRLVAGIELTAVEDGRDVHVLGYFFDPASRVLREFLQEQRQDRVRRVREMGARLAALGFPIDVDTLVARAAAAGVSIGRPALADALIAAGHAPGRDAAFARWLGRGRPAFVPRRGAGAATIVKIVHEAGGLASLAHPGLLAEDALIPSLAAAGLDALEVWHTDHAPADRARYFELAAGHGLARTGGSDYHGEAVHRAARLGGVDLPADEFSRLESRLAGGGP
jgi:predicted metal-dependent phosphoesterase TrpH